jgi:hypothetical protein
MKNLLITAALVGGIAAPAYADQWVDTNTGMALGADSDEAARLKRDDCAQGFLDDAAPL